MKNILSLKQVVQTSMLSKKQPMHTWTRILPSILLRFYGNLFRDLIHVFVCISVCFTVTTATPTERSYYAYFEKRVGFATVSNLNRLVFKGSTLKNAQ